MRSYNPRHAIGRAVRSLPRWAQASILGAAASVAVATGVVTALPSSASTPCTAAGNQYESVTGGTTTYYLGVANSRAAGSAARLKPAQNNTTLLIHCNANDSSQNVELIAVASDGTSTGLALTSRDALAGGNVTLEVAKQYPSQTWTWADTTGNGGPFTFRNLKTGLFLRVRNSGPKIGQTVTTGNTPTVWTQP